MGTNCTLCREISRHEDQMPWNVPILETENFVILPSLGSLVEGWLLIIPKQHFICVGAMPEHLIREIDELKAGVAHRLEEKYGAFVAFEHGPERPHCDVGCGVDHAHLHLVPFAGDLSKSVEPFMPDDSSWTEATLFDCVVAHEKGDDYLYYEQPLNVGRISRCEGFSSQIFRKAIASSVGLLAEFNWRQFPQHSRVTDTIESLVTEDLIQQCSTEIRKAA